MTNRTAAQIADATKDAYSFNYYGNLNWYHCCDVLKTRGYSAIEIEAIMRSKLTRLAYDSRDNARAKGTAANLEWLLNSMNADELSAFIAEVVDSITNPEPEKLNSRDVLRLAWSN